MANFHDESSSETGLEAAFDSLSFEPKSSSSRTDELFTSLPSHKLPSSTSYWHMTDLEAVGVYYDSEFKSVSAILDMIHEHTGMFAPLTENQKEGVKRCQDRITISSSVDEIFLTGSPMADLCLKKITQHLQLRVSDKTQFLSPQPRQTTEQETATTEQETATTEQETATTGEQETATTGEQETATMEREGNLEAVHSPHPRQITRQETATTGEQETAITGEQETATIGEQETATTGEQETATTGEQKTATMEREGNLEAVHSPHPRQITRQETATTGEQETAITGEQETATIGEQETATTGEQETATTGEQETATMEREGNLEAVHSPHPRQITRQETATTGEQETAITGEQETATTGEQKTATAGEQKTATTGEQETATIEQEGNMGNLEACIIVRKQSSSTNIAEDFIRNIVVMVKRAVESKRNVTEAVFVDLFKSFVKMCGLIPISGDEWRSTKLILHQEVTSAADIVIQSEGYLDYTGWKTAVSVVSIEEVKNMTYHKANKSKTGNNTTEEKQKPKKRPLRKTSSKEGDHLLHEEPLIFKRVKKRVLAQHGGELLLHCSIYSSKYIDEQRKCYLLPGMIVIGPQVTFTLLEYNFDHLREVENNSVVEASRSYIYYSEPKDLLKKEDRDLLIESFARLCNST